MTSAPSASLFSPSPTLTFPPLRCHHHPPFLLGS
jgi:hypothetical protein